MFERFTDGARHVVVQAQEEARRLGHNYIGCEHLLLAAAQIQRAGRCRSCASTASHPSGWRRNSCASPGADSATGPADRGPGLDREALAAIGIDLDVVRDRIEAAFGPNALDRAVLSPSEPAGLGRRPPWRKDLAAGLRHARRSRRARRVRLPGPAPQAHPKTPLFPGRAHGGHIPFTPRAKKSLELSLRQALAQHDNYIGLQHLILALLTMKDGTPRRILADLGASPDALRAAILDRYRKAS